MRSAIGAFALVLVTCAGRFAGAGAQEPEPVSVADSVASVGILSGFGGTTDAGFGHLGLELAVFRGSRGWAARGSFSEEFTLFGPEPALRVWDLGLLRTFRSPPQVAVAQLGVGAAITGGMNRGRRIGHTGGLFGSATYEEEPFLTAGAIATAALRFAPFRSLAIGGSASANLNAYRSFLAVSLTLSVGAVR